MCSTPAPELRCERFALVDKPPTDEPPLELRADPQWRQAARDLPARRRVVRRVLALLRPQRQPADAAQLAKRVELALYSRADSLEEFAAPATLRRRVQALVAASVHEAHALADLRARAGKRAAPASPAQPASPKRQRRAVPCVSVPSAASAAVCASPLLASEDVTRAVMAFLDGKQVLRLRQLNSLASALLPSCVASIRLDAAQLLRAMDASPSQLAALVNLRQLVVFKPSAALLPPAEREPSPSPMLAPLRAGGCAELAPTAANDGERAVCQLAGLLHRLPKLESLQLAAIFCNTGARNGAKLLADALAAGACPLLQDLVLGGNHLADAGALELARAVASGRLPRLARLDLRRNYVGDRGAAALLQALAAAPPNELRALCLGGNLLTDASADRVVALVRRARLAFLGLEDNFLTADGVQAVVRGAAHKL